MDTNGDGNLDTIKMDTTGDGKKDTIMRDTRGTGTVLRGPSQWRVFGTRCCRVRVFDTEVQKIAYM